MGLGGNRIGVQGDGTHLLQLLADLVVGRQLLFHVIGAGQHLQHPRHRHREHRHDEQVEHHQPEDHHQAGDAPAKAQAMVQPVRRGRQDRGQQQRDDGGNEERLPQAQGDDHAEHQQQVDADAAWPC